jgi:putative acetyltransferase
VVPSWHSDRWCPLRLARPAEPEDLPAIRRLLGEAPWEAATDDVVAASMVRTDGLTHRLVGLSGDAITSYARLVISGRPRIRHIGTLDLVAVDVAAGTHLLAHFVDLAERWMALLRVDTSLDEGNLLAGAFRDSGFVPSVRRVGGWRRTGVTRDLVTWTRVRPDLVPPAVTPALVTRPSAPRLAGLEVRVATPDDAAATAARMASPSVLWGTHQTGTTPAAFWRERLDPREGALSLVVAHEGVLLGNGGIVPLGGDRAHCAGLGMSIASEAQGLGAGDALMSGLVEGARALGYERLELDVYADNDRAERLYRKHGFVDEGLTPFAAWRDGEWATDRAMVRWLGG